jgi:hypothetical protein
MLRWENYRVGLSIAEIVISKLSIGIIYDPIAPSKFLECSTGGVITGVLVTKAMPL